jgi:RNA polymerase sigma-70 factor (ECF subfamily)
VSDKRPRALPVEVQRVDIQPDDARSSAGLAHHNDAFTTPLDCRGVDAQHEADYRCQLSTSDVTTLLRAWGQGDVQARDRLMPLVYAELHRRAAACLRRERQGHTLQPTALVNEAYLRLVEQRVVWQNRAQFLAVAAPMMRRVLVDHARRGKMAKRSGRWVRVTLVEHVAEAPARDVQLVDLDAALSRLATFDPRKSQIADLRFCGGLSLEETGHVLGLSIATVEPEWQAARAWLYARVTGSRGVDA